MGRRGTVTGVGRTLAEMGCKESAVDHLRRAADDRGDASDYQWLGTTLADLGREVEAVPYLKLAVEQRGDPSDYQGLVKTLLKLGRNEEARVCFEQAVQRHGHAADPSPRHGASPDSTRTSSGPVSSDDEPRGSARPVGGDSPAESPPPRHTESHNPPLARGLSLRWSELSKEAQTSLSQIEQKGASEGVWSYPIMTNASLALRLLTGLAGLACLYFWIVNGDNDSSFWFVLAAFPSAYIT